MDAGVDGRLVHRLVKRSLDVLEGAVVSESTPLRVDAHPPVLALHALHVLHLLHVAGVCPRPCGDEDTHQPSQRGPKHDYPCPTVTANSTKTLLYLNRAIKKTGFSSPWRRPPVFRVVYQVTDDQPDLAALVPVATAHHRSHGVVHHGNRSDLEVLRGRGERQAG